MRFSKMRSISKIGIGAQLLVLAFVVVAAGCCASDIECLDGQLRSMQTPEGEARFLSLSKQQQVDIVAWELGHTIPTHSRFERLLAGKEVARLLLDRSETEHDYMTQASILIILGSFKDDDRQDLDPASIQRALARCAKLSSVSPSPVCVRAQSLLIKSK